MGFIANFSHRMVLLRKYYRMLELIKTSRRNMQSIEKPKEQKQTEDIISKQNTVIPGISKFR